LGFRRTVGGHFAIHHDHCTLLLGFGFEVVLKDVHADLGLRVGTGSQHQHQHQHAQIVVAPVWLTKNYYLRTGVSTAEYVCQQAPSVLERDQRGFGIWVLGFGFRV
jgi:hypothetical protein